MAKPAFLRQLRTPDFAGQTGRLRINCVPTDQRKLVMTRFASGHLALIAAMAILTTGCATTEPRVSFSYYSISGSTSAELDREIARKGPKQGHTPAYTAIRFVPVVLKREETAEGCRVVEAAFRVEARVTLPRWREQASSDNTDLRVAWKFLSEYAREHEAQHVRIAEKHAPKFGDALVALPAKRTCEALDPAIDAAIDKVHAAYNREQEAFDAAEKKTAGATVRHLISALERIPVRLNRLSAGTRSSFREVPAAPRQAPCGCGQPPCRWSRGSRSTAATGSSCP